MTLVVFDIEFLEGNSCQGAGKIQGRNCVGIYIPPTERVQANISSKVEHKEFTWNQLE